MKIESYFVSRPQKGMCKQWSIMAKQKGENVYWPVVYLQRPKWIKDDSAWDKICSGIILHLKKGTEVK